jgi:hypothetical protein
MAHSPDSKGRRDDLSVRAAGGDVPATPDQREAAVERLSEAFAHDLLPMDEFERRVAEAYRVPLRIDLWRLTADLPQMAPTRVAVTTLDSESGSSPQLPARVRGFFSSVERAGFVEVPARVEVSSRFASIELDLSTVWFPPGITEIDIRGVFGNVEIQLPPDVIIENEGEWVLSSVRCERMPLRDEETEVPPAIVRITGRTVLSNVEITTKPSPRRRPRR